MAIFELYSQRQANALKTENSDVYQYNDIPCTLRNQIKQIALEGLGLGHFKQYSRYEENEWWYNIEKIFLREKGLDSLQRTGDPADRILLYMQICQTEDWLDLLELITISITALGKTEYSLDRAQWDVSTSAHDAIDEINYRLRQAGVGYQIEDTRLIKIDSQFIHAEIVKPTLMLLSKKGFKGPKDEFLCAHQHYRAGEYRQAVAMAANAFESTFKAIFEHKQWPYKKGARISDLMKVARTHKLWPNYLDNNFDQLVATLQNGLPKIRDNEASHGQGAETKQVPPYIAAYALHLAATNIVFLVEAAKLSPD